MGRVKEGGKAGLLAGLIYAVVEAAAVVTLLVVFKSTVIATVSSELSAGSTLNGSAAYDGLVVTDAVVAVVFGILAGVALGLLFGAVWDRLPGRRAVTKGVVFGLILWLFLHVIADYFENLKYGVTFYIVDIGLGLGTSLVYGALLGLFFEREMRTLGSLAANKGADVEGTTEGG